MVMQKSLEAIGFLVLLAGISGIVNHLWSGWHIFNLLNGVLIGRLLPVLSPFELYLDLTAVAFGLVVMLAASTLSPQRA
jgi:uncharacterized membrane protein